MDIRQKFRNQKNRHKKLEPNLDPVGQRAVGWEGKLLDKLTDRIEQILVGQNLPTNQLESRQEPPPKISFDDLDSILNKIKEE